MTNKLSASEKAYYKLASKSLKDCLTVIEYYKGALRLKRYKREDDTSELSMLKSLGKLKTKLQSNKTL